MLTVFQLIWTWAVYWTFSLHTYALGSATCCQHPMRKDPPELLLAASNEEGNLNATDPCCHPMSGFASCRLTETDHVPSQPIWRATSVQDGNGVDDRRKRRAHSTILWTSCRPELGFGMSCLWTQTKRDLKCNKWGTYIHGCHLTNIYLTSHLHTGVRSSLSFHIHEISCCCLSSFITSIDIKVISALAKLTRKQAFPCLLVLQGTEHWPH